MEARDALIILHALGAAILLGSVTLAGIVGFTKTLGEKTLVFSKLVNKVVLWSVVLLVATGILLVAPAKEGFLGDKLFLTKMGLFVLSGIIAQGIVGFKVRQAKSEPEQVAVYQKFGPLLTLSSFLLYLVAALGILLTLR